VSNQPRLNSSLDGWSYVVGDSLPTRFRGSS